MWLSIIILLLTSLVCSGCLSGNVNYTPPVTTPQPGGNTKVLDRSRESVWATAVPELGKHYFVINNIDKSSGLINLSYTGDPETFIDCGFIHSDVTNARGYRTYDFSGARAYQTFETMDGLELFYIERKMSLDGRINLIFEEMEQNRTRVTANTRYVVTRNSTIRSLNYPYPRYQNDTIAFNTDQMGASSGSSKLRCISTGKLERELLNLVK